MVYHRRSFTNYSAEGLLDHIAEVLGRAPGRSHFQVRLTDVPAGRVNIVYAEDGSVIVEAPTTYESAERRDHFTNAWMVCVPLLAEVRRRCPPLAGQSVFWVDDVPLGPGLAFSGNSPSMILLPDQQFLESDGYQNVRDARDHGLPRWETRKPTILWRGSTTGLREYLRIQRVEDIPRIALAIKAKEIGRPEHLDIKISQIVQIWNQDDIDRIHALGITSELVSLLDFMNYKGAMDIDGNSNSWSGLFTKFIMENTLFKVDSYLGYRQWYYNKLTPWKNFVPISSSLNDLNDLVDWFLNSDKEIRLIASRGRALADSLTLKAVIAETSARLVDFISRGRLSAA